jgi:hypothetical protein
MTTTFTLVRGAALAAVCAAGFLGAGPATAAPEDVALLHEYLGNWKGTGAVVGPDSTESAACRLDLIDGNGDKINFRGRCSLFGTTVTMNGTMAYFEASQSYESVMTTSIGFTGRAVGTRSGDVIRFDLMSVGGDPSADNLDVVASFIMANGAIDIGVSVVFKDSGDKYVASAPLSR